MSDLINREDAISAVTIAVLSDKDEIEALTAIPSAEAKGDLISRTEAIAIMTGALEQIEETEGIAIVDRAVYWTLEDYAEEAFSTAPSAEAVPGEWRTSKPTENGDYMVTLDAWGHRYIAIMHYSKPQMPNREVIGTCWYRYDDEWGDVVYDDEDILAWMPLPTPYKGGDDE